MKPSGRAVVERLAVVGGAVLVLAAIQAHEGSFPPPSTDQVAINLMVLSRLHPDWFQGDLLYGAGLHRHYCPAWLAPHAALARWLDGDPYAALRVMYWPLGLFFLLAHYALFRALTGHPLASFLGAVAAMPYRLALGGDSWDYVGLLSVIPRTVLSGLAPLYVLGFVRWGGLRGSLGLHFLLGAAANVHPVGALHLAQIGVLARLWEGRCSRASWRSVAAAAGGFALGAAPLLITYLGGRAAVADPALFPLVREAVLYRLPQDYFPRALLVLPGLLIQAVPPLVLLMLVARDEGSPLWRALVRFGVLALGVGLVGAAADQLVGDLGNRLYPGLKQLRATRFAWLPLLAAFPLACQRVLRGGARRVAVALTLFAAIALSLPPVRDWLPARARAPWEPPLARLDARVMRALAPRGSRVRQGPEVSELARWVADNTCRNDRFFTDLTGFRILVERPITGSFKDGGYILMAGTEPFLRWYVHLREVDACRRRRGEGCWFALARRTGADYVVVDPHVPAASPEPGYALAWRGGGWSVWRREGSRPCAGGAPPAGLNR